VSEKVYQQINLYQPIFRRQRLVFSAVTMLQSVAVVAIALMTIYVYGVWQVGGLELQALELEGREKAYSAQLARLDPSVNERRRAGMQRDLEALNATLLAQQRLIEVLREQPLGSAAGFSDQLAALGRRHRPGLWLTKLSINGGTSAIELVGRSTDPGMVPAYLLRLGDEEALEGQRFDEFEIERSESGDEVRFRVSSKAVAQ
jgi:Tfp pilus assembly protein PilN